MVPDRAGSDTHVDVQVALAELLDMNGASVLTDAWLRAKAGEDGYLSGDDARAIACDALIVPVVTGSPQWDLIDQMTSMVLDAYGHDRPSAPLPSEAWEALRYALARLAIGFVSGPVLPVPP